jgi:glycosyltransferase involved in cell wall biosynthesis
VPRFLQKNSLSIIVPVLNEGGSLELLRSRLVNVLEDLDLQWDIILVDDGSTDDTLTQIRRMNDEDSRIKSVALSRNFGKENAVAAGLRYATGDAAIIIDGDLQHPPELLQEFVRLWRGGYDVVYGERTDRKGLPTPRNALANIFYGLFRALSGICLPKGAGDFRLLSRRAVDAMNQLGERARFNKGLFAWIGFRSIGVPYTPAERRHGKPKWKLQRLFGFAIDGITAFSTIPLRVWSYLGLGISLLALCYAAFFLISTLLFGRDIPGFPSLIISIMLLAGVQLISLGVIGEYLGRVYEEVKRRPLYLVAEEIGIGHCVVEKQNQQATSHERKAAR